MDIGLLLSITKLSLEIFKDERGDLYSRLMKKQNELEKEHNEEMSKPDTRRDDFKLDTLLLRSKLHARIVLAEASKRK